MVTDFIPKLTAQLLKPLPGAQAQYKMAPIGRVANDLTIIEGLNPKKGSVLILLFPSGDDYSLVYIKRTVYVGVHSGQISFPGGKFEPSDITDERTAIRETMEEIGIDGSKIKIIGKLTRLYIPPSNFLVSPFIGFMDKKPSFQIDKREVESIIETNVSELLNVFCKVEEKPIKTSQDLIITAPFVDIKGYHVWGATAMISNEFVEVLKKIV